MKSLVLSSFLVTLLLSLTCARKAEIPNLICRDQQAVEIDPISLEATSLTTETTYRVAGSVLYIAEPNRGEYRYNTIAEGTSPGVVTSANFTIISRDPSYEGAVTFVHSDQVRILVSRANCSRQAE